RLMSLGIYPGTSLSEARNKRSDAKKLIANGVCPTDERVRLKEQTTTIWENTFKKIALEWHNNQTNLADTTKQLHIRRLERDIFPHIGTAPISRITPKQILDKVLRPMEARGVGEMTYRVKSIISQVFRYGVACGYVERDATTDLVGALKKVERGHRAAITDPAGLAPLLRAIDDYDGYFVVKCALQLAPLLFVRPGELRSMKWANIDLEIAEWRYYISKTKTEHLVPLAQQAITILQSLHPLTSSGELVFPSVRSTTRPISDNTLNAALRRMGFTKDEVSTHGFRATARTILEEILHEKVEYIEHQLAHSVKDPLGRAYNRTKHLDQRKRMMQVWADYLDGLKMKNP
ncbi:MAG: tyrosine-type recombinase/integrase, partial [Desulfocapsa sp.]|nr:tyrosine-type recombinase/integrase [Desulfocapsa sp.]